ncbi:MAG: hypothetical protein COA78_02110 [Blastopirellula sp.]|nr:MAG: hypothetical protein COA78_02110 [Blastopirellula sp.]
MGTPIFLKDILLYYDTPQLFAACDLVGTNYLCMLVEQSSDIDKFACVSLSEQKLIHFTTGKVDLREIFLYPEIKQFFQLDVLDYQSNDFEIESLSAPEFPLHWLPEEGVLINNIQSQSEIIVESKQKARTIVHLSLNPPESINEPRINALTLSDALLCFQTMLKYAYKRSIAVLPSDKRKQLNVNENYQLDVFGFAHGSFRVKMQSQAYQNLLGETEIIKALELVDKLVENIDNPEESLQLLLENKGHFASSYIRFLKHIADGKSKISYSWAYSALEEPLTKQITSDQAQRLFELFNHQDELKEEEIELIGFFDKIDIKLGKWRLVDQGREIHNGELGEVEGLTLQGVVIGTELYKLKCVEKIFEIHGTSEEKKSLQIIDLIPLSPQEDTD